MLDWDEKRRLMVVSADEERREVIAQATSRLAAAREAARAAEEAAEDEVALVHQLSKRGEFEPWAEANGLVRRTADRMRKRSYARLAQQQSMDLGLEEAE